MGVVLFFFINIWRKKQKLKMAPTTLMAYLWTLKNKQDIKKVIAIRNDKWNNSLA